MTDSVEQFRQIMVPQLDLRCEAKNLERFILHFAETDTVNFPAPVNEYTTNSILTESFIRGDRIMSYANPKAAKKDKEVRLGEEGRKSGAERQQHITHHYK